MKQQESSETYHGKLRRIMNEYVHVVYRLSRKFPREEMFGVTSQLRRSTLSIILNYIEGYARIKNKVHKNFLEISYGSLQESKYLLGFALEEKYITKEEYDKVAPLAEEIGAMLWKTLSNIND